jgi:16S rRNA G966 N2-methylase RsmD
MTKRAIDTETGEIIAESASKIELSPTGMIVNDDLTYKEWSENLARLRTMEGAIQWWIGDSLNYGEHQWGDKYAEAVNESEVKTWQAYASVAGRYEFTIRMVNLSWSHHQVVAYVPEPRRSELLEDAVTYEWSVAELKRAAKQAKQQDEIAAQAVTFTGLVDVINADMLVALPTLEERYSLVVADPPYNVTDWRWDVIGDSFLTEVESWLTAIQGVLCPEYNLFWFCSPSYAADTEMVLRKLSLPIQSRIVWSRRNMAMGSHAKSKFIDTWEMIFHCGNRPLNFPDEWSDAWFDVQEFAVPQTNFDDNKIHPTQKPLALFERLVEFGSYPGDHILDPFAGGGTTGAACQVVGLRTTTCRTQPRRTTR